MPVGTRTVDHHSHCRGAYRRVEFLGYARDECSRFEPDCAKPPPGSSDPETPLRRCGLRSTGSSVRSRNSRRPPTRASSGLRRSSRSAMTASLKCESAWPACGRAQPTRERTSSDTPLVSVVIPTYDRGELLVNRAIPSVLAQTYENVEIVVVGDAAPESTGERLRDLGDPRITYRNLTLRGPYPEDARDRWHVAGVPARNAAVALAHGEWIAPLDDDDAFHRPRRAATRPGATGALRGRLRTDAVRHERRHRVPSGGPSHRAMATSAGSRLSSTQACASSNGARRLAVRVTRRLVALPPHDARWGSLRHGRHGCHRPLRVPLQTRRRSA